MPPAVAHNRPSMAKARKKLSRKTLATIQGRFAEHLRALMDKRDWAVGDLQDRLKHAGLECTKATIHMWLRAETMPKAADLETLGNVLGLRDYRDVLPPPK